jgi:hypothetical protein
MFSLIIITGLASLAGCFCMALVCAAQLGELFATVYPAKAAEPAWRPWEREFAISCQAGPALAA